MRVKNSIKNTTAAIVSNILTILIGLVAQAVFIKILGTEYLGINGLFTNIISMLGIVELGIGSAIVYNLYKPIANRDKETIKSLMNFYKKAYHIIALVVFIIGISIIPFLSYFIGETIVDININLVYLLFIIDIVCSYLLTYKRSLLYADQKNYIINIIHMIYLVTLNISQLLLLYITKNYYLYLGIKIILRIIENVVITIIVNKKYSYLKEKNIKKLDKKIEKDIFQKVKALFFHKIGSFIVLGTDNLIISRYLGIITVGLYSNYYMIINALNTLFSQAITALTPSVGNLLVEKNSNKNFEVFRKVRFINFWIATFTSVALLIIMNSFITFWIGEAYLLSNLVLITLVINFFMTMMRNSYSTFKEAAGIFHEDRYVPIIESFVNIVASIILLKYFGLAGVFMGTIISGLILWCYSYPKFVYKKLFCRSYLSYIKETISYIILFILILIISYKISNIYTFYNIWVQLLYNIIVSLIIPNIILLIIFYKNDNLKYYYRLFKKLVKKS